jgi:hypothetical protein
VSCEGSFNVGLVICGNNLIQCFKEPRATPPPHREWASSGEDDYREAV